MANLAIIFAAGRGDLAEVNRLIAGGANVNEGAANAVTPLVSAIMNNHPDVVRRLIEAGADLLLPGNMFNPLHTAVNVHNPDMVDILLDHIFSIHGVAAIGIHHHMFGTPLQNVNNRLAVPALAPQIRMNLERIRDFLSPAGISQRMARIAWNRRKTLVSAWETARARDQDDYNYDEDEEGNQGGGRRRSRRRRSSRRKAAKKSYRRRH